MEIALEHLLLRMRPLHRRLDALVEERARKTDATTATGVNEVCVTEEDARLLLTHLDEQARGTRAHGAGSLLDCPQLALTDPERGLETLLRAQAADQGMRLPLDALRQDLALDDQEIAALLVCAAPEFDSSYELLFGFLVDDLARRFASVELIGQVITSGVTERLRVRAKLGLSSRLCRFGLLRRVDAAAPSGRHIVLRLTEAALWYLMSGQNESSRLFSDAHAVPADRGVPDPVGVDLQRLDAIGEGLRRGLVDCVGCWGPAGTAIEHGVLALADRAGCALRTLDFIDMDSGVQVARELNALLWVETDALLRPGREELRTRFTRLVQDSSVRFCLSGVHPFRPLSLLCSRRFAELRFVEPGWKERTRMWRQELPELSEESARRFAARFRVSGSRLRAAARLSKTQAALLSNGVRYLARDHLEPALSVVTQVHSTRFTTVIEPRRTEQDLILPDKVYKAVMEVVAFFRASVQINEEWGMAHMVTGGSGVQALFTGESGTGKTLAAEVIAGALRLPLLRVDLAKVVSKWVGETEQNLEVAFQEAESSQAVLFFDEADALFGKRGQVQKGTDRYANLEVSYLLQRLEDYTGVAILATNLRENIDKAFIRRFQIAVHFPRPGREERARIWRRSFPEAAPLDDEVDLDLLAGLDLTGAGIVSSARVAAMLAAQRGASTIQMEDLIGAVARQFQREARILSARELGPFADLLGVQG